MIKGLIFDLDGVLVSTETNHYVAWKLIADELKIPFSEKENEKLKGLSRADSLSALLDLGKKSISHLKFKTILDYKNKIYLKSIEKINQTNLLPGVLEFIKEKHEKNYLLAVGSSSKNAHFILKKLKLIISLVALLMEIWLKKPKPDPEVFIKASVGLGLAPSECLVFEDAESGVIAAKKGGFRVIGVGNIEIQESCDYFIKHMGEFDLSSYEKSI